MPAWKVAPLLFASGFCALVYQIAWQREFRLIFGASTAASASVVAVFMGGLGLGGRVLGPWADRRDNPLRFYALLEGLVTVSAACTPPLLGLVRAAYVGMGGTAALGPAVGTAVRLAFAALVLLPPTFLAGGTLGAAARFVEGEGDRRRRATALLYGVNTLGAVAGCVAATFALLETFGTRRALWLAALLNGLVAVVAWVLARPHGRPDAADAPGPARSSAPPGFVLAAAATVGFAFFLMELVWYRMLGPILGGTVYTFGLVLAVALLGIGLGAFLYALTFARIAVTLEAFAVTCLLEAALVGLPYALRRPPRAPRVAAALRPAVDAGGGLASYLTGWGAVTAITVLPASDRRRRAVPAARGAARGRAGAGGAAPGARVLVEHGGRDRGGPRRRLRAAAAPHGARLLAALGLAAGPVGGGGGDGPSRAPPLLGHSRHRPGHGQHRRLARGGARDGAHGRARAGARRPRGGADVRRREPSAP